MRRTPLLIATLGLSFLLAACDPTDVVTTPLDPAGSACLVGDPDCQDTGPSAEDSETGARSMLGLARHELADDVRIARIDEVQFPLTEDYVIGRVTVELDTDTNGTARVTSVLVEHEDGPITVTA